MLCAVAKDNLSRYISLEELVRRAEPHTTMRAQYSTREVAKLVNMSTAQVRAYVRAGLVGARSSDSAKETALKRGLRYSFRDLLVLRLAHQLLTQGLSATHVRRALLSLQRSATVPISCARLQSDAGRVVASDGATFWDAESGQYLLRFSTSRAAEPAATAGALVRLPERGAASELPLSSPFSADELFDAAFELEEKAPEQAHSLYLRVLASDPEHVEATINVGRLCFAAGDLKRAAAFFRQAIRVDASHPVAQFNLAVVLHDLGDLDDAMQAYRAALTHDPDFADAHYNLATLFEQRGCSEAALRHFNAYRMVAREPAP